MDTLGSIPEGRLAPSEALEGVLRVVRLAGERIALARAEAAPVAHEVSLTYLVELEETLGLRLPNDVVTLAVLRIPLLRRACGLDVASLASPPRDCAGELGPPRGWVPIASYGERAMERDVALTHVGVDTLLSIARPGSERHLEPTIRTTDAETSSKPEPLSAFLRGRITRRFQFDPLWREVLAEAATDARPLDDAYAVRVVDDRRRPAPAAERRVRHAKFGVGTVLREVEGGKLEIAFEGAGTKTLLRSFVVDA